VWYTLINQTCMSAVFMPAAQVHPGESNSSWMMSDKLTLDDQKLVFAVSMPAARVHPGESNSSWMMSDKSENI